MNYEEASGPELIVQHTGQIFPLGMEIITIGSQEDNLIILTDPHVSPHHATISWQAKAGGYMMEDLGSAEGTFVNEVRIEAPRALRHGDVIRMGNTVMDLRSPPPTQPARQEPLLPQTDFEESERPPRKSMWIGILVVVLAGLTICCIALLATLFLTGGRGTPDVIIQSPAASAQLAAGNEIILQATASGATDITLLELNVDGALVATINDPNGTSTLTVRKPWVFDTPGEYVISAEAFTASGKMSQPASVKVTVVPTIAEATVTPTTAPGQPTATPTSTLAPTDTPQPQDTATPTSTPIPPPQIEYFRASPASINAGTCTTLEWGQVSNATEARIQPDIGGVGTPGSETVCPIETTTYVLTAKGPGGTAEASTTVTVIGGLPDLTVDSITFSPNPPVAGQENQVQITLRNVGIGAAGAFDWQWQAGSDALFDGRVTGLNAGDSTVMSVIWTPAQPYDSLRTEARVDTRNEVIETDKGNNQLVAIVQVVKGVTEPQTVILSSEAALDGYWLNDGSGSNNQDILVGNGELVDPFGELVARGFMSFDVSGIPAGATIESVALRFYQKTIQGDPYGKLGNLVLEHVYYGTSLDDSAYNTPALGSAMLAVQSSPGSWYVLSDPTITSWVQSNLAAGRIRFQLRLQFRQQTDGDGQEDWVAIEPGRGALASRNSPQLTITYVP